MKRQIAGFLGELAEELGWTPELEEARVKEATTRPETRQPRPIALTPDPVDPQSLTSPVERLRSELDQLRSTVKHLGAEVIYLRAQLAKMRNLPLPPDAQETHGASLPLAEQPDVARTRPTAPELPLEESTKTARDQGGIALVDGQATEDAPGGPWPRLHDVTDSEAAPARPQADADLPASDAELPVSDPAPDKDVVVELTPTQPPPDLREPEAGPAPTVVEVDDDEHSALEMFPSEPPPAERPDRYNRSSRHPKRHDKR